jgi:predicted dehydrogenase
MQAVAGSHIAEIAAIADPAENALEEAARIAPEAELMATADELLTRRLDGVVIASPSALHADQTLAALHRGIAVFCQKPVGRTAAETRELAAAARRANRLIGTDFAYRFTAGMKAVRELIRSGNLGRIYAADLCFHNAYGPDKAWYYDASLSGGGCLIDLGTHLVDLLLWVLDFPEVCQVSGRIFHQGSRFRDRQQVEDFATAELDLTGDISVHIACSWRRPMGRDAVIRAIFHGERGAAEFQNVDGSFYDFRADRYWAGGQRQLCGPPDNWGGRALLNWLECLVRNNRFSPSAETIVRVAEVIDAIYSAATVEQQARSRGPEHNV